MLFTLKSSRDTPKTEKFVPFLSSVVALSILRRTPPPVKSSLSNKLDPKQKTIQAFNIDA